MAAKDSLAVGAGNRNTSSYAADQRVSVQQQSTAHDMSEIRDVEGMRMDEDRPMAMSSSAEATMEGVHEKPSSASEAAAAAHQSDEDITDGDSDGNKNNCPLFMSGLPRDFASNPGLAAIASLLGETVEEEDDDNDAGRSRQNRSTKDTGSSSRVASVNPRAGGGKVGGAAAASRRKGGGSKASGASSNTTKFRHRPYPTPDKKDAKQKATVGEAQLFLNMWKL